MTILTREAADHVYHWKHGWIPLDHTAAGEKTTGWKPTMSSSEADKWAQGSAITDSMYHGTSTAAASSIGKTGFQTGSDTHVAPNLFGHGIYLGSKETATNYAGHSGTALETKVHVTSPWVANPTDANSDFVKFFNSYRTEHPTATAAEFSKALTAEAQRRGHDAIWVKWGANHELIVFDPKNVVVVQ